MIYDFTGDYKSAYRAAIDDCYASGGTALDRMTTVQAMTDAYVAQTGERPESTQLDRLATWILLGDAEERKMAQLATNGTVA